MKTCNCCGKIHTVVPENARILVDHEGEENGLSGLYWECACGSTLFRPFTAEEFFQAMLGEEQRAA